MSGIVFSRPVCEHQLLPMRRLHTILVLALLTQSGLAADIQSLDRSGTLTWSGAYTAGVVNVQTRGSLLAPWQPRQNYYTSNLVGSAQVSVSPTQTFVRLLSVDISTNSPNHYTNLLRSYGILETVAGRGRTNVDVSQWSNRFEGEWATNVDLSRPHTAFGDPWGNVLIVDQRSHSVLRVTPQAGFIRTPALTSRATTGIRAGPRICT